MTLVAPYCSARSVAAATAEVLRPPRRVLPSEACAAHLRTEKGEWSADLTPELVEPLDLLASRDYRGIVFVGPARSGKTMTLVLGAVAYVVTSAPGDMLIVQMTQDVARDFSRMDLDRMLRHSPAIGSRISPRARDDNTFDKFFRSGIVVKLGWPSVAQLSGKTLQYVVITDYDRPANRDDVDGEGPLFDLAGKRVQTFMSRGKVLAESSPEIELGGELAHWTPSTPHEGPPVRGGIVSLYNRGTRARRYWQCQHCGTYMQIAPGLAPFALPPDDELQKMVLTADLMDLAGSLAKVVCQSCGGLHEQSQRPAMKASARWVHEGETVAPDGRVRGARRQTEVASYWLGGAAAAFQRWDSLLLNYFTALATYVRSGDERPLKFTVNTEQAAPYVPRAVRNKRSAKQLRERCEDWPKGVAPQGVRFLTAQVDVQASRFVVHVDGWGVGLERWLVDRFVISASRRPEGDRHAALDPAAYLEDWRVLKDEVVLREYPVEGVPGARLSVRLTLCDSGGRAGVTERAYAFWREMRDLELGRRFMLVKGDHGLNLPRARLAWPDSSDRSDRHAGGRGDVPVWLLNVNVLKDGLVGDLARDVRGPGYVHLPRWVDPEFFDEMTVETRTDRGWKKPASARNEAFDLMVYGRAACIALRAESIDWSEPPEWAAEPAPPPTVPAGALTPEAPPPAVGPPAPAGGYLGRRRGYLGGR